MTDETTTEVEIEPSELDLEQRQRVEALWQARGLLTGEASTSSPFGKTDSPYVLGTKKKFADDMTMVAQFILTGAAIYPAPFAEIMPAEAECDEACCKVAAEWGDAGGMVPITFTERPDQPHGPVDADADERDIVEEA